MKVRNLEPHPTTPLARAAAGEPTEIVEADREQHLMPRDQERVRHYLSQRAEDHLTAFLLGGIVVFVVVALLAELSERVARWIAG